MKLRKTLRTLALLSLTVLSFGTSFDARAYGNTAVLKSILKECYSGAAIPSTEENPTVNGHALSDEETQNVRWIGRCVLPFLSGTKPEKAEMLAKATWWALREGNLGLTGAKIHRYSICHGRDDRDHVKSKFPLYVCPTDTWQVGMASGQAMVYDEKTYSAKVHDVIENLDPKLDEKDLLAWTAELAGAIPGSNIHTSIIHSKGRLKRSWLARNPLVGFAVIGKAAVEQQCYIQKRDWCFKGSYPEAKNYSGSKKGMIKAVGDLENYFLGH